MYDIFLPQQQLTPETQKNTDNTTEKVLLTDGSVRRGHRYMEHVHLWEKKYKLLN